MWKNTLPLILGTALCWSPQLAAAEMVVNDVSFAVDVMDREPSGSLTPGAYCENGRNSQNGQASAIPVLDSSTDAKIYFWTKVQSSTGGVLHHTWYRSDDQGWTESADIMLNIAESAAYRTWSSKNIDRSLHLGEWKVEVSNADEPGKILCTARFRVE